MDHNPHYGVLLVVQRNDNEDRDEEVDCKQDDYCIGSQAKARSAVALLARVVRSFSLQIILDQFSVGVGVQIIIPIIGLMLAVFAFERLDNLEKVELEGECVENLWTVDAIELEIVKF